MKRAWPVRDVIIGLFGVLFFFGAIACVSQMYQTLTASDAEMLETALKSNMTVSEARQSYIMIYGVLMLVSIACGTGLILLAKAAVPKARQDPNASGSPQGTMAPAAAYPPVSGMPGAAPSASPQPNAAAPAEFCRYCGRPLPPDGAFCDGCGAQVR